MTLLASALVVGASVLGRKPPVGQSGGGITGQAGPAGRDEPADIRP